MRVVEDVEKFESDIKSEILFNLRPLQYSEIGVVESRAVEETTVGGAKTTENAVLNKSSPGWDTRVQSRVEVRFWWNEVTLRSRGCRAIGIRVTRIISVDLADEIRHIRGRTASQ